MSVKEFNLGLDCESIAKKVIDNRSNWVDRYELFYTLGAAAYLDNKNPKPSLNKYQDRLKKYNKILKSEFGGVIESLCDYFKAELHDEIACPGFHIFDERANGFDNSIHVDTPYSNLSIYSDDLKNARSFTVLIQKPSSGAGLYVWDDKKTKKFIDYQIGIMYIHDCGLLHQIASDLNISKDEYRITLQGHVITFSGKTYIYF